MRFPTRSKGDRAERAVSDELDRKLIEYVVELIAPHGHARRHSAIKTQELQKVHSAVKRGRQRHILFINDDADLGSLLAKEKKSRLVEGREASPHVHEGDSASTPTSEESVGLRRAAGLFLNRNDFRGCSFDVSE
jgi:hypothetical protein